MKKNVIRGTYKQRGFRRVIPGYHMPYDRRFSVEDDGRITEELCHATGYEICDYMPAGNVYMNEYIDRVGYYHYA